MDPETHHRALEQIAESMGVHRTEQSYRAIQTTEEVGILCRSRVLHDPQKQHMSPSLKYRNDPCRLTLSGLRPGARFVMKLLVL